MLYLVQCSRYCISAKDFRTFFASSRALERLQGCDGAEIGRWSEKDYRSNRPRDLALNSPTTPSIARKSYIHPVVIEAFEANLLVYPVRCRPRSRFDCRRNGVGSIPRTPHITERSK
jgi:DNA topoisomerase IB